MINAHPRHAYGALDCKVPCEWQAAARVQVNDHFNRNSSRRRNRVAILNRRETCLHIGQILNRLERLLMACLIEKLPLFIDKKLNLDEQLVLLDHLDTCEVCFEELFRLWKERDRRLFRVRNARSSPSSSISMLESSDNKMD